MKLVLVLVLVLVCSGSGTAAAEGKHVAYAIVIGNNTPPSTGTRESLQPLRYADDDAVRYFQLFSRFADSHLLTVLDTQTQRRYPGMAAHSLPPTLDNLNHIVDELAAKMRADRQRGDLPDLYFAFSGHGARDDRGEPFLAMLDGALTQKTLYDGVLGRMPTEYTHLIVDACHAGGVVGVRGGGFFEHELETRRAPVTAAEVDPILQATPLARYPNIGVILATTIDQEAHEWSAIESGVFTHELLSGLLGAADVNGDLVVEYSEAQAFVAAANRDIKDPRAIPHVIARPPAANQHAALVTLPQLAGTRLVRGDASTLGHFYIELDDGQRYLDAHADGKTPIAVAVPDATAAFLRTDAGEATLPLHGAITLATLVLDTARNVASRGSIDTAYRSALFASSYGRAYYQGFVDSGRSARRQLCGAARRRRRRGRSAVASSPDRDRDRGRRRYRRGDLDHRRHPRVRGARRLRRDDAATASRRRQGSLRPGLSDRDRIGRGRRRGGGRDGSGVASCGPRPGQGGARARRRARRVRARSRAVVVNFVRPTQRVAA